MVSLNDCYDNGSMRIEDDSRIG